MRSISRARGLLATLVPFALTAACSDPDLASELDTEGPPEVVEVNVRTESAVLGPGDPSGLQAGESATFCRPGEEFLVNTTYCPLARDATNAPIPGDRALAEPARDADPRTWYVRVIFTELLDPSIETLETNDSGMVVGSIRGSQPFVVTCGGAPIEYDGWMDPSGNHLSYPPGPALVATFTDFIATGSACEISINDNVTDKDGNSVVGDHAGPYEFGIAPLAVYSVGPADGSEGVALDASIEIELNAPTDPTSATTTVVLTDADGAVVPLQAPLNPTEDGVIIDDAFVIVSPVDPLAPNTTYTVTISSGIADAAGGLLALEEPIVQSFTTGE